MLHILSASWWEPGSPDTLDIGDITAILVLFITIGTVWRILTKWWAKELQRMIRENVAEIVQEFTKTIQPNANGGNSLPDVVKELKTVKKSVVEVNDRVNSTQNLFLMYLAERAGTKSKEEDNTNPPDD